MNGWKMEKRVVGAMMAKQRIELAAWLRERVEVGEGGLKRRVFISRFCRFRIG